MFLEKALEKKIAIPALLLISLLAILFLFWLIYFNESQTQFEWVQHLAAVNAFLNASSAACLILGFRAIRAGQTEIHKRFMLSAFACSSLFLVSYIIYHSLHGDTKFLAQGLIRPIYFFTLISHIVLSVVALPLVFITFYFALTQGFESHKKLARITFPLWLYVSVTGVLIFVLIKLFNPA